MQINSYTAPQVKTNPQFKGYQICKVPDELRKVLTSNDAFNDLANNYDVFVSATARNLKLTDPFRFRVPKADEKAFVKFLLSKKDTGELLIRFDNTVKGNLCAPLAEHINELARRIEKIDMSTRVSRLMNK